MKFLLCWALARYENGRLRSSMRLLGRPEGFVDERPTTRQIWCYQPPDSEKNPISWACLAISIRAKFGCKALDGLCPPLRDVFFGLRFRDGRRTGLHPRIPATHEGRE